MVIAKKYVVLNAFKGIPNRNYFRIVEEELPSLNDNGKP